MCTWCLCTLKLPHQCTCQLSGSCIKHSCHFRNISVDIEWKAYRKFHNRIVAITSGVTKFTNRFCFGTTNLWDVKSVVKFRVVFGVNISKWLPVWQFPNVWKMFKQKGCGLILSLHLCYQIAKKLISVGLMIDKCKQVFQLAVHGVWVTPKRRKYTPEIHWENWQDLHSAEVTCANNRSSSIEVEKEEKLTWQHKEFKDHSFGKSESDGIWQLPLFWKIGKKVFSFETQLHHLKYVASRENLSKTNIYVTVLLLNLLFGRGAAASRSRR